MNNSLNRWLRDAHAMEIEVASLLDTQSRRMQDYPDLKTRFELHLRETQAQRQKLEPYLELQPRLVAQSAKSDNRDTEEPMDRDEILKFATSFYVSKYREIAAYRVLLTAAEAVEDSEIAELCEEMLWIEDAMAAWLRVKLPELVRDCLTEHDSPVARRHEGPRHPHH